MRKGRLLSLLAIPVAVSLAVAGCGGGTEGGGEAGAKTDPNGTLVYAEVEPEALVPAADNAHPSIFATQLLFTPLVTTEGKKGEKTDEGVAESIKTDDSKLFTITLKKGWKFHDGTEVKAKNFVDAWNYAAYKDHGYKDASYFAKIKGYQDVNPDDEKAKPTTDKMSGLKTTGDYTFTVELSDPFAVFPTILGYAAFSPIPDSAIADPEGFKKKPIGNGPFKFVSRDVGNSITFERFDGYSGPRKPKFKTLQWKNYQSLDAAYDDVVAGKAVDFVYSVPTKAIAGNAYQKDAPGRYTERNVYSMQILDIVNYQAAWNYPDIRKAISMAIDREAITKAVYEGKRKPVTGFTLEGLPGYKEGACGDLCKYNKDKANEAYNKAKAAGFKETTLNIRSNADGGHKEWIEATCKSIEQTIPLKCHFEAVQQFKDLRALINKYQVPDGAFRAAWGADYPDIENFLTPLYAKDGSSNDTKYRNPAFDAKMKEGDGAKSLDEAHAKYNEAEALLANDMPAIPLWNYFEVGVASPKLKPGTYEKTCQSDIDLYKVEVLATS